MGESRFGKGFLFSDEGVTFAKVLASHSAEEVLLDTLAGGHLHDDMMRDAKSCYDGWAKKIGVDDKLSDKR